MHISELNVNQFRNLQRQTITFNPFLNVFVGKNAQGKTNIAENIFIHVFLKSFRNNKLSDLIHYNEEFATSEIHFNNNDGFQNLKVVISKSKTKTFKNDVEIIKKLDFIGNLNVVIFIPDDLFMLKLSPSIRRNFIDLSISQVDSEYASFLNKYQKIMKQRNTYMKTNITNNDKYLIFINENLYHFGKLINNKRIDFINFLNIKGAEIFNKLTDNKEILNIKHENNISYDDFDFFMNALSVTFESDYLKKETKLGIHRDDLQFLINDVDAKKFASQGQQRTIILALKLALIEYIFEKRGEYPVLILDDVFSEIDIDRKNMLLHYLSNKVQTFITTTDFKYLEQFLQKNEYKVFNVENGRIKEDNEYGTTV